MTTPYNARLTADVPNSTTVMASLTDLTLTLAAASYFGRFILKCNNTVAAEGIQLDFNGGTAVMTRFWAIAFVLRQGGTVSGGTTISTSLAGILGALTLTGECLFEIVLFLNISQAGTFIPRVAEATSVTGTLTAEVGSHLWLNLLSN